MRGTNGQPEDGGTAHIEPYACVKGNREVTARDGMGLSVTWARHHLRSWPRSAGIRRSGRNHDPRGADRLIIVAGVALCEGGPAAAGSRWSSSVSGKQIGRLDVAWCRLTCCYLAS